MTGTLLTPLFWCVRAVSRRNAYAIQRDRWSFAHHRRIVERHGGEVWVDSEEGKGVTLFFTLSPVDAD